MMRILSVDLASVDPANLGIAMLESVEAQPPLVSFVGYGDLGLRKPMSPVNLGSALVRLANSLECSALAVDGPQAWKSPGNDLVHSRVCDRCFNSPAKVGLPESAKPRTYLGFVSFSIQLFNVLATLGWPRMASQNLDGSVATLAMEALPLAAWRTLGLRALPAKRKCSKDTLEQRWSDLAAFARMDERPNHDQLQAVVGGLGPLRLVEGRTKEVIAGGRPPVFEDGYWREGFIVCAQRKAPNSGVRADC